MTCEHCGAAMHPAATFCRMCGGERSASAAPTVLERIARLVRIDAPVEMARALVHRVRRQALMPHVPPLRSIARPRDIAPRASTVGALAVVALIAVGVGGFARGWAGAGIAERDQRITTLEARAAEDARTLADAQAATQAAQRERDGLRDARDSTQQQVTMLEAKIAQVEAKLAEQQAQITRQQQDLKTLSTCLNGTAVALAFGRSGRWSAADTALAAVSSACSQAGPLMR